MFSRLYFCKCGNNKTIVDTNIIDIDKDKDNDNNLKEELKNDMDITRHFYNTQDRIEIIKQKIEHYVIFTEDELKFIKNLSKNDIFDLILWYNKNNAKY
jgi:hypothetical protein